MTPLLRCCGSRDGTPVSEFPTASPTSPQVWPLLGDPTPLPILRERVSLPHTFRACAEQPEPQSDDLLLPLVRDPASSALDGTTVQGSPLAMRSEDGGVMKRLLSAFADRLRAKAAIRRKRDLKRASEKQEDP